MTATDVDLFGSATRGARSIGGHESNIGGTDEWLTPPGIIVALGPFDTDPCSPIVRPWPTAHRHYTIEDDGLRRPWEGRVWLNPPLSTCATWLQHLANHGTGTALLFARTDTRAWFDHVWPQASGLLFLRGRVAFHFIDGRVAARPAGAPSVLVSYGAVDAERLSTSGLDGHYVALTNTHQEVHS